ncbi:hypothetical protein ACLK1S_02325 [Escherichia coli]
MRLAHNGSASVGSSVDNFNGDNGTINYDGMLTASWSVLNTKIDGNNAKWIVGAAAGFAKGGA